MSERDWQTHWEERTDGGHRSQEESFLRKEAAEKKFHLGASASVLDFGCGSADLLAYFADAVEYAVGVDFSASMLARARERLDAMGARNITVFQADDESLWGQLGDQRFDAITAAGVLQYFTLARMDRFFANAARFLTSRGRIVIFDLIDPRIYFLYEMGLFPDPPVGRSFLPKVSVGMVRAMINSMFPSRRGMGHAHYPRDVRVVAERHGFAADVAWSMYYEYRYHVICERSGASAAE